MKALLSREIDGRVQSDLLEVKKPTLNDGEVLIKAEYSSLNYKDALAVTGRGKILKSLPMIAGIDVAGTIEESKSPDFKAGDYILVTGCGLGETHNGGYSEYVKEEAIHVVRCGSNISARDSMIYGTAGFTAALSIERLLLLGQKPEMGPMLVTGASGGVGQFAVHFLHKLGFEVHALTSKREFGDRLRHIGAKEVIFTSQWELGTRPLESVRYGGAIDNLGGKTLAKILAHTQLWGNVGAIGLAESHELQTTVMPFILRGVSLIGISSNNTPVELRHKIWHRLAGDLKPDTLDSFVTTTVALDGIVAQAEKMLGQQTHGRTIVNLTSS